MKPLVFLLLASWSAAAAQGVDWNAVRNGVVRIDADSQHGAGIIVLWQSDVARIMTANHVVENKKEVLVTFYWDQETKLRAKVLEHVDRTFDLAMLEVRVAPKQMGRNRIPSFAIRKSSSIVPGENISIMNSDWSYEKCTTIAQALTSDPREIYYTRGRTGPGFSGGPIFDAQGQLMGMHSESFGGAKVLFAGGVRVEAAKLLLQSIGLQTPLLGDASVLDGEWGLFSTVTGQSMPVVFEMPNVTVGIQGQPYGLSGTFTFDGRQIHMSLSHMVNLNSGGPLPNIPESDSHQGAQFLERMLGLDDITVQGDGTFMTGPGESGERLRLIRTGAQ
jgi:hypothetical protein